MSTNKRPNNYYLETYLAVKQGIGSRLHEIGRKVAIVLDIDEEVIVDSPKNEWGYKLEGAFKKKIENNLKNLWNDGKIFKQYFDNENYPLEESQIASMTGSQYSTYYYPTMAKSQIRNEGLLLSLGINIVPLNNNLTFSCHEIADKNPEPEKRSRILFVNDYNRAVCFDFDHLDLPITFCISNNAKDKNFAIEDCLKKLTEKDISTNRVAAIFLENNSYEYKDIPQGNWVAVTFTESREIIFHNLLPGYIEIGSDLFDYIPSNRQEYLTRLKEIYKRTSGLSKAEEKKELESFHFGLKVEGFSKEKYELNSLESSEDLSHYEPLYSNLLGYQLVFYQGK